MKKPLGAKEFINERGNKYVKVAVTTKKIEYTRSSGTAPIVTRKGTKIYFVRECEERKKEGRKRLFSFIFPDKQTFPLWEEEFEWIEDQYID